MMKRRRLLQLGLAASVSMSKITGVSGQIVKAAPLPEELEGGDLLWPKIPGAFIPYTYSENRAAEEDAAAWTAQRDETVAALRASLDMGNVTLLNELKDLTYAEFRSRYLNGSLPGQIQNYSSGGVAAVGHVAIVEVDPNGNRYIIEATPPDVIRRTYEQWLAVNAGAVVWHGRIRNRSADERTAFADESRRYLSRAYDFWNFDLLDDRAFYCSKLVWLASWRSLNLALDNDENPHRSFWLSPKQILNSPRINILLDQGDYTFD